VAERWQRGGRERWQREVAERRQRGGREVGQSIATKRENLSEIRVAPPRSALNKC